MYLWPEIAAGAIRLGYVNAGGLRTRYVEAGDASAREAVVFIPGTGGILKPLRATCCRTPRISGPSRST
jgi:2-hydroxy-6-oxonona-2,4-dienedioate hydrolase